MKLAILLAIIILAGCTTLNETQTKISGTQDLILNEQDLSEIGMTSNVQESDVQLFELGKGTNCRTDNGYSNIVDSSIGQYSVCVYYIPGLDNTQLIIELQKFADYEALNGTYQYSSSHLFGAKGIISENTFGDQSKFHVNSEDDYGAEFNQPGIYYYHLWFTKDLYLVHVTSKGSENAKEYISKIGNMILQKFY